MRSFLSFLCLVVGLAGLTACGKYHGHYGERYYQVSDRSLPPLQVPHGIPSPVAQQLFPVPNVHSTAPVTVSLVPPDPHLRHALAQLHAAQKKG